MKIISILPTVKFGGVERLMIDLGRYFKKNNIDFIIVSLTKSEEFENELQKENIKFLRLTNFSTRITPSKKEYLFLFFKLSLYIFKLRKILKNENPEVILSNGFPTVLIVPIAFLTKKTKSIYIHHFLKSKENRLVRKIYLHFLKKYKKIVAVSSLTKKSLIEVFPEIREKIVCIPNGLDCQKYDIKEDKTSIRKKLNLPDGIIGICVGRLAFFKNQKFLIEIAKNINKEDFYILIAGEGEEYENLKNLIKKENLEKRIKLLGHVSPEKIPYYLNASDIFIYPSLKEGFGLVILEAMSSGLPVIIFKDIYIEEFGNSVLIAENEKEFIELVAKLVNDENLRKKLGEENKKYARENLDISKTAENYLKLFNE